MDFDENDAIAYIRAHIPADVAALYDDNELLNLIDIIFDYYEANGLLDLDIDDDDADDDQRSANDDRVVHELLLIGPRDTLHLGLDRSEILLGAGEETRLLVLLGLRSLLVLLGNGLLGLNLGVGGSAVGRCRLLSLLLVLLVGHLGYLRAMRLYMSKP